MVDWAVRFRGIFPVTNYWEDLPVIPGVRGASPFAEGHGAAATGGRHATAVWYFVNTDAELLAALIATGFRYIVPCTSRYYDPSNGADIAVPPNYTILGYWCPGPFEIRHHSGLTFESNGVIEHVASRPGAVDLSGMTNNVDCFRVRGNGNLVYMNHVSLTWGHDENFSNNPSSPQDRDLTLSNALVAEPCLDDSGGAQRHEGTLIQERTRTFSLIRNLQAFSRNRNPQIDDDTLGEIINNGAHRTQSNAPFANQAWGQQHQGVGREALPNFAAYLGCVHDAHPATDRSVSNALHMDNTMAVGTQIYVDDPRNLFIWFDGVQTPENTNPDDGSRWLFTKTSNGSKGDRQRNGGFDNTDFWTLETAWQISGGVASQTVPTVSEIHEQANLYGGILYRVTFDVLNSTGGGITPRIGGTSGTPVVGNGRFTQTVVSGFGNDDADRIGWLADGIWDGQIDNVEVNEERVAWGDLSQSLEWVLGLNWQIVAGLASQTSPTPSNFDQATVVLEGHLYRVTFDTASRTVGGLTPGLGGTTASAITTNGSQSVDILAGANGVLRFAADGTWNGSVTNISVLELDVWSEEENAANPVRMSAIHTVVPSVDAWAHLIANVGSRPLARGPIDARIIADIVSGVHLVDLNGNGLVDVNNMRHEGEVGGYLPFTEFTVDHEELMALEGMPNDAARNAIDPVSLYCFGEIYGFRHREGQPVGAEHGLPQVQGLFA